MNARSCGDARAGGKYRYSNHMSAKILNPNDDACKKLWRDEGRSLDLETA